MSSLDITVRASSELGREPGDTGVRPARRPRRGRSAAVAGPSGSIRPPARRRKGLVVTFGKGRVPDSAVLAGVAPEIGLRVTVTLVGMASGPAADGLSLVVHLGSETAVTDWA